MAMNTSMTVILPEKTDLSQVPVVYLPLLSVYRRTR